MEEEKFTWPQLTLHAVTQNRTQEASPLKQAAPEQSPATGQNSEVSMDQF